MPRLVLDANVAASGLLWPGAPSLLIQAAIQGQITFATGAALLDELAKILQRARFASIIAKQGVSIASLLARYATVCDLVRPAAISALAAHADIIVSGDRHLLNLKHYQRISILSPAAAVQTLLTK